MVTTLDYSDGKLAVGNQAWFTARYVGGRGNSAVLDSQLYGPVLIA